MDSFGKLRVWTKQLSRASPLEQRRSGLSVRQARAFGSGACRPNLEFVHEPLTCAKKTNRSTAARNEISLSVASGANFMRRWFSRANRIVTDRRERAGDRCNARSNSWRDPVRQPTGQLRAARAALAHRLWHSLGRQKSGLWPGHRGRTCWEEKQLGRSPRGARPSFGITPAPRNTPRRAEIERQASTGRS